MTIIGIGLHHSYAKSTCSAKGHDLDVTFSGSVQQPRILVVDDEKNLREMLEYNLRREGYHVVTAADGNEAVRLAYAELPNLIILDIMLPGMSGLDVCREIRRELTMPILMLSA